MPAALETRDFIVTATNSATIPNYNPLRIFQGCADESEAVAKMVKASGLNHETACSHQFRTYEVGTDAYTRELEKLLAELPEEAEKYPVVDLQAIKAQKQQPPAPAAPEVDLDMISKQFRSVLIEKGLTNPAKIREFLASGGKLTDLHGIADAGAAAIAKAVEETGGE